MKQPVFVPVYTRAARAQIYIHDIDQTRFKSTERILWGTIFMAALLISFFLMEINPAHAASKRVVVLGDSLTSGYGLEGGQGFPEQLQIALQEDGLDVQVDNAGVSGDTTAGGLSRLEWALEGDQTPDLVIVALGANDMLRGLPVDSTKKNLASILEQLRQKNIPTLLAGMRAPAQYSILFRGNFNKIYTNLAKEYDVSLYPFFLEGVALSPEMNQTDGMHPNQKGVAVMVENIAPLVKELLGPDHKK